MGGPSSLYQLTLHRQDVPRMLPARDIALTGHSSHCADPALALYLPGSHATHVSPFSPV